MTPATGYHEHVKNVALENNVFSTGLNSQKELLASSVIYGANGSGKSNVLEVMDVFRKMTLGVKSSHPNAEKYSRNLEGREITTDRYKPFLFNEKTSKACCSFEIDFIADKVRYVYSFSFDEERIHHEKLDFYPNFELEKRSPYAVNIYEIELQKDGEFKFSFSKKYFEGDATVAVDLFKTTQNNLFLPLNVNEDGNTFLIPIYNWVKNEVVISDRHRLTYAVNNLLDDCYMTYFTHNRLIDEGCLDEVSKFIKKADTGIDRISFDFGNGVIHKIDGNSYSLPINQISDGTKMLFCLAGMMLPILKGGGVLCADNLEANIHPDLLVHIIKMFHDPKINTGNGQLIFTAYDDILLDKVFSERTETDTSLLRRDQVWFTSKSTKEKKTDLYSLVEFCGIRNKDNIAKKYRNYDFGARPVIQDFYWEKNEKKCHKCQKMRKYSEFHKDKTHKDGYSSACKLCKRPLVKEYNKNNPEKRKVRKQKYAKKNKQQKKLTMCLRNNIDPREWTVV